MSSCSLLSTLHTWVSSWVALDKLLNWKHWKLPDSESISSARADAAVSRKDADIWSKLVKTKLITFIPGSRGRRHHRDDPLELEECVLAAEAGHLHPHHPGRGGPGAGDWGHNPACPRWRQYQGGEYRQDLFPFPLYLNKWSGDYPIFNPCKVSSAPHFIFYDAWPREGGEWDITTFILTILLWGISSFFDL